MVRKAPVGAYGGERVNVMDFISYKFFSLIQYYLYFPNSVNYLLIMRHCHGRLVGEARYLYQTLASGKGSTPQ